MDESKNQNFKELLDKEYSWPAFYSFKFIVPFKDVSKVRSLFPPETTNEKPSKHGNYVSVNANIEMKNAEEVMDIYSKASEIDGVIAL